MSKDLFFSIVVTAHNEDEYIEESLRHLAALEYPKESYEVIVVDNDSADWTYDKAKTFASETVSVVKIAETDISKARESAATLVKKESSDEDSGWVLFLDTDTLPDPRFLRSLANFLNARANYGYVVGTFELHPQASFLMKILYSFINLGFRINHVAYGGALLVKRPLLDAVSFDGNLMIKEGEELADKLPTLTSFFFFSTNLLQTSGRRFAHDTWNTIQALSKKCLSAKSMQRQNKLIAAVIWE